MKINSYTSIHFANGKPVSVSWDFHGMREWPENEEMKNEVERKLFSEGFNVEVGKIKFPDDEYDCHSAQIKIRPKMVDDVEVQKDQVWQTKNCNLVYVIEQTNGQLGFLWYDHIDKDFNIADVRNQLALHREEYDMIRWANEVKNYQPVPVQVKETV